ncbi:hypothetical protein M0813_27048 [Anaeramoeba flamelloides]|uniref:RING-type domain-containing protein n=1 Tax=Anaeramoeba flamelloides TaxID=1746091 RepID=A0ABQ8XY13_9EUKA|nr:hypothetical protein M0813_27048 [Anaeramoeba flamelloides]
MRGFHLYALISTIAATGTIVSHLQKNDHQFFPAFLHLAKSTLGSYLFTNELLVALIYFITFVKTIFFGKLTQSEIDLCWENGWQFGFDVLFAAAIFFSEFSIPIFLLFAVLICVKSLMIITSQRLLSVSQELQISFFTKMKLTSIIFLLNTFNTILFFNFLVSMVESFPNILSIFVFQFLLLVIDGINLTFRLILIFFAQSRMSVFLLYIDPIKEFIKLFLTGFLFLALLFSFGVPLHMFREMYTAILKFYNSMKNLFEFRRVISEMNRTFPDVTQEDLDRENLCIFCRLDMNIGDSKKLPCNHCFHVNCLSTWLQQKRACPICDREL